MSQWKTPRTPTSLWDDSVTAEENNKDQPAKASGFAGSVELILTAVTPVTVVTALLVYVGSVRSRAFYGYFGLDQSLLNPSVQDYALGSADVTFGAVVRLVSAGLVFLVLDRAFVHFQKRALTSSTRAATSAAGAVGVAWLLIGLLSALGVADGFGVPPLGAAAVLAIGAGVVLRLGSGLLANSPVQARSTTVALYTLLVLALFWAATLYAQDLGQRAAKAVDANPAGLPLVTIFSREYLDLPGSQVQPTRTTGADNHAYYRYSGLSLLNHSDGTWFLVTGRYSDDYRSSVLILRDSDTVNVEIAAPGR